MEMLFEFLANFVKLSKAVLDLLILDLTSANCLQLHPVLLTSKWHSQVFYLQNIGFWDFASILSIPVFWTFISSPTLLKVSAIILVFSAIDLNYFLSKQYHQQNQDISQIFELTNFSWTSRYLGGREIVIICIPVWPLLKSQKIKLRVFLLT